MENLMHIDITKYPSMLKIVEDGISEVKSKIDILEKKAGYIKAVETSTVDKEKYKNASIRENNIVLALAKNIEYDTMDNEILKLKQDLRELNAQHAEVRRVFRLLEAEYSTHGVRTFAGMLAGVE